MYINYKYISEQFEYKFVFLFLPVCAVLFRPTANYNTGIKYRLRRQRETKRDGKDGLAVNA